MNRIDAIVNWLDIFAWKELTVHECIVSLKDDGYTDAEIHQAFQRYYGS